VEQTTDPADYPYARSVQHNVPIYGPRVYDHATDTVERRAVQAELVRALMDGPGIVVFQRAFDPATVDPATEVFAGLIAEESASGSAAGDHFAEPGANDRLWDGLDKLAVSHPEVFFDYYATDVLDLA